MAKKFITDQVFKGIDFSSTHIEMADFENCQFINCNFLNADISQRHFEDCIFEQCDLSNTKINQAAFRNIRFRSSKLIGLQFDTCHPFLLSFQFIDCILNYSSFYQLKIPGTVFRKCMMQEVDLSDTVLDNALFEECNLIGAMFGNTSLRNADLYSSTGFVFDPEKNNILGARISVASLPGLLTKYSIIIEG